MKNNLCLELFDKDILKYKKISVTKNEIPQAIAYSRFGYMNLVVLPIPDPPIIMQ